ncbi:MAG: endonuclease III [Spirochaetes bacterium]|nr:MAG: endonuclease III [Spirochaetota bacterium]
MKKPSATPRMREYLHRIERILVPLWPDARPLLHSSSCFELLCAVILSAQTTDEQVNKVTGPLFAAYPTPEAMALAKPENLEVLIGSLGFYRVKARHLIGTAKRLVQHFDSKVPSSMEGLLSLSGVGRKRASANRASSLIPTCPESSTVLVSTRAGTPRRSRN